MKGGGNGRGARFANNPIPVSNRNGGCSASWLSQSPAYEATEYERMIQDARAGAAIASRRGLSRSDVGDGWGDVLVAVMSAARHVMGIPATDASADPLGRKPLLLADMLEIIQSDCECACMQARLRCRNLEIGRLDDW